MKPRFTLRDLFWLVLAIGMGCAWWVESQAAIHQRREREQWQWRAETVKDWVQLNRNGNVAWFGNGMKITEPNGASYNYTRRSD